eukprot:1187532-Prorocentrum_minimum.AAC.4
MVTFVTPTRQLELATPTRQLELFWWCGGVRNAVTKWTRGVNAQPAAVRVEGEGKWAHIPVGCVAPLT